MSVDRFRLALWVQVCLPTMVACSHHLWRLSTPSGQIATPPHPPCLSSLPPHAPVLVCGGGLVDRGLGSCPNLFTAYSLNAGMSYKISFMAATIRSSLGSVSVAGGRVCATFVACITIDSAALSTSNRTDRLCLMCCSAGRTRIPVCAHA